MKKKRKSETRTRVGTANKNFIGTLVRTIRMLILMQSNEGFICLCKNANIVDAPDERFAGNRTKIAVSRISLEFIDYK